MGGSNISGLINREARVTKHLRGEILVHAGVLRSSRCKGSLLVNKLYFGQIMFSKEEHAFT